MSSLLDFLQLATRFIVVLGIVVAFHELGHFLTAKLFNVRVDVFSLGFGRRLFGRRIGETEYRVSLIPLGGYVLMAGENGLDPERPPDPRDFDARPAWMRFLIMAAGPFASALLSVLIMWAAYMAGMEVAAYRSEPARIGSVAAESPAMAAGLQPGDLVVSVGGKPARNWDALEQAVLMSPKATLVLGIERAGSLMEVPVAVEARGTHAVGWMGAEPCVRVVVRSVTAGSPAQAAGLAVGDEIVRLGGETACAPSRVSEHVQASQGAALAVEVLRDGAPLSLSVTPQFDEAAGRWLMGIAPGGATVVERFGPARALGASLVHNMDTARLVVEALAKLATGQLSFRSMSGPIEMASMTDQVADAGLMPLLVFVALISMNLAIFNLLPIPILDGGRMALLLVEALRGRDLERRTKEWILQAGLAMIVVLMVTVIAFDLIKKWGR